MVREAVPYEELEGLADYYLEDSYVLGICIDPDELTLKMEVILTESHPNYEAPKENEQYCYRKACLRFVGISYLESFNVLWSLSVDANGEKDMGNIYELEVLDNDLYHISGPWGKIRVRASNALVSLV